MTPFLLLAVSCAAQQASPAAVSPRHLKQAQEAYLAGARAVERNELTEADRDFTRALALNPNNGSYVLALAVAREHELGQAVQQAEQARSAGDTAKAEALLAQARRFDPANRIVTQHDPSTHSAPDAQAPFVRITPASLPSGAAAILPERELGQRYQGIRPAITLGGPIELQPTTSVRGFDIKGDVRDIVTQVAQSYGIRVVFDASVAAKSLQLRLDPAPYPQTMPTLLRMASLMSVPLDSTTLLVARDTRENREQFERQLEETIYLPALTTTALSDVNNVIRNIFEVRQATLNANSGSILLRAPANTLHAVNQTIGDLIDGGGEVMIDVKLLEIDKSFNRNTGITPPQQFGVYSVQAEASTLVSNNQALLTQGIASGLVPANSTIIQQALYLLASGLVTDTNLSNTLAFVGRYGTTTLNGVTSPVPLAGITVGNFPTLNLSLNVSDTRALDDVQLRISDRESATFRAGTRYPITTATYSSAASSINSSALASAGISGQSAAALLAQFSSSNSAVVPQVQYEDLGVTLKLTPTILKTGSISCQIDLKIEALAGTAANGIPVLANRQYVSAISMADGETALLVSNLSLSESRAIDSLPGLGELPGFQDVTDKNVAKNTADLVILMTPHIVRHRSSQLAGPRISLTPPPAGSQGPQEP